MFDVIIVGGGLVGSSCALALGKALPEYKIALIEATKPNFTYAGFDNRIYAISPKNMANLLSLVTDLDDSRFGTIEQMSVAGDSNSKIEFSHNDCHAQYLSKIVEYRNLQKSLLNEIEKHENISLIYTQLMDKLDNAETVKLYDKNGQIYEAKWLIAADGANSFVRRQCKIEPQQINYYQSGVVANFKCEKPHYNTAYQWFLDSGILAYLPLPDNQISIVYSTDEYQKLLDLSSDEFCKCIAQLSGNKLGNLELVNPPLAFPLKLNLIDKLYENKVIFIGDAAHTIHPLAGQGVNLGFGDVWELVKLFKLNQINTTDLNRYSALRLTEVKTMQMLCHGLNRLFSNRSGLVKFVRNSGLNIFNKLGVIKKQLITHAVRY